MAKKTTESADSRRTIDEVRADLWRQEEKLEAALRGIRLALDALDEAAGVLPISRGKQMIDRIALYLDHCGRAFTREELVKALLDAGAGSGRSDAAAQISKSIDYHTIDKRVKNHRLKISKGLIGLAEWGEEKFRP